MGVDFTVVAPRELYPADELVETGRQFAQSSGAAVAVTSDIEEGLKGADAVYTDVWASMGEDAKLEERKKILGPYQVTEELMKKTGNPHAIFMHCLPAVKGNEVTFDVIEGKQSRVWDEAENRKHTIKALMLATI
jgi:ornithine carbamoyltransferase